MAFCHRTELVAVRPSERQSPPKCHKEDGTSPQERFAKVNVAPKLRNAHTFGCPVYALTNRLQSGGRQPKWVLRARLGINLGPSPRHAGSDNLVMSLTTGLVSPQFHVQFDDFFETVRLSAGNEPSASKWQLLSCLRTNKSREVTAADDACQCRRPIVTSWGTNANRGHRVGIHGQRGPYLCSRCQRPRQDE